MEEGSSSTPTRGTHWTSSPLDELELKIGKEGNSALPPVNVFAPFLRNAKEYPDKVALSITKDGKTVTYTWKQYYDEVVLCARAIRTFDLAPNSGVNILGFNSPEWFIADLAAIAAGGIAAPIYTTNGPEAVQYIANHSEAVVAFVENELQLKKYLAIRKDLPHLKAIVQWSGTVPEEKDVYSWKDFLELGQKVPEEDVLKVMQELKPTKCCTLIYTSGTTGPPKAVMLSNDNVAWTARAAGGFLKVSDKDRMVSYLPLSHIAAQMVDLHIPIAFACTTYFAQPDALKGTLANTLKEARPTLFLGVPRVWEKMQEKMMEVAKSSSGFKKNIASWAKGVGLRSAYAEQDGKSKPWGGWLANALVYSKVRDALGLDQARLCGSAAAPIAKETLEFFYSLGIPIYEIYGMSESTGPQTVDTPWAYRIGTTGKVFDGAEIKIDNPDKDGNGEILFRGRHVFMGYMKDPKSTSETIDGEGWLHSGDIGKVDNGFLSITGRIKELIITAGGENIPPVLIEDEIKKELGQVVANVMVIGDRKKFLSCLVTLKAKPVDVKPGEYPFSEELADSVRNAVGDETLKTVEDGVKSEALRKYIQAGIDKANKRATSNAQRIQKFQILKKDFTIETGELTPTLKLKRRIVVQNNTEIIEEMYNVDE